MTHAILETEKRIQRMTSRIGHLLAANDDPWAQVDALLRRQIEGA